MNTVEKPMYEWNQIPWRKLEKMVFKLQKRIFQASQRGDVKTVRRLQRLLMKSWSAKCLSVRPVTQDNQGRKTKGVDRVKSLSPEARLKLVGRLKIDSKSKPTKRVWIPKPGKDEKRPLGIPTMYDRALQTLVKMALEPEWEAKFEENSYGFRPGRSVHDAVEAIFSCIRLKPKYVLDADITKCFDQIDHSKLLTKLNASPTIKRQIKAWLKAGVIDDRQRLATEEGTPQGGTISPLLANIALHGMEERIKQFSETLPSINNQDSKRDRRKRLRLIRYADRFVVLHDDLEVIKQSQVILSEWLKEIGLELKPSKTRISHTLVPYEGTVGFDFLGFNFRQYPVGKNHTGKNSHGKTLGFKTIIKPSEEKVREQYRRLAETVDKYSNAPQYALIGALNKIIREWSKYYSTVCSRSLFSEIDSLLFQKLWRWATRRHPRKGKKWVKKKYWHPLQNSQWGFRTLGKIRVYLYRHSDTNIVRFTKVSGNRSPYDGDWVYWGARMGKDPKLSPTKAKLLTLQKGKCALCGLNFSDGDLIELDHKVPKNKGDSNQKTNFQLLHRHCHDLKTSIDASLFQGQGDLEDWYA
ncbi:group II intron reverse transcriptase/maturase [Microseira sp. BLCC-F43]|jgi:RNA-directed DNA polymerase|uniref:group II intron reverse transcriptase/maturase n=1 Tax=Microseira sp. BLCC-F43 TaxID=3153602 RepID=UPI0035BB3D3E